MYSYTQWTCNAFRSFLRDLVSPIIVWITAQSGKRKALNDSLHLTLFTSAHVTLRPCCTPIAEAVDITQQQTLKIYLQSWVKEAEAFSP